MAEPSPNPETQGPSRKEWRAFWIIMAIPPIGSYLGTVFHVEVVYTAFGAMGTLAAGTYGGLFMSRRIGGSTLNRVVSAVFFIPTLIYLTGMVSFWGCSVGSGGRF